MSKFFYVMGIIFSILLIIIGLSAGGIYLYARHLDHDSKDFVDSAVPAIAHSWDANIWYQYIDQKKSAISDDQVAQFLTTLQDKLGDLKEYKESKGDAGINLYLGARKLVMSAKYVVSIECDHGPAIINIALLKENGDWKIVGFHITSPALDAVANQPPPASALEKK